MARILAGPGGHHHGHAPAGEIKRDLVDLAERGRDGALVAHFGVLKHRHIEQVLQAGLVVAVEVGILQDGIGVDAEGIEVAYRKMRSCVSVPVLSVHKTSMAPKF